MSDDSTETESEASAEAEAPAADVTEATEAALKLMSSAAEVQLSGKGGQVDVTA